MFVFDFKLLYLLDDPKFDVRGSYKLFYRNHALFLFNTSYISLSRHDELLNIDGLYAEMWMQQLQGDSLESKISDESNGSD